MFDMGALTGAVLGGTMGLIGAHQNRVAQNEANEKNAQMQREFAQNGIRWKVEDAKAAGIHPLYALGASGYSAAPSYVGDTSTGAAMSNMGQDITRAIQSGRSSEEQDLAKLQLASAKADIYGKQIENAIKAETLRQMSGASKGVPGSTNFIPGQGDSNNLVKEKPLEKTVSQPGRPGQEAGWRPDVSYSRSDYAFHPQIPETLSESMEDQLIPQVMWGLRNYVMPNVGMGEKPADSQLPKGAATWEWDRKKQGWVPVPWSKYKGRRTHSPEWVDKNTEKVRRPYDK